MSSKIRTHILSGALGVGKSTILRYILQHKPKHETWAVLVNELGQIGVDQMMLAQQSNIEVQALLGGCLCCNAQLALQVAINKLIKQIQPDRIWIEPSGAAHVLPLLQQLTQPHWHSVLDVAALITVLDGRSLPTTIAAIPMALDQQLRQSQIVVLSHADHMRDAEYRALTQLQQHYLAYVQQWQQCAHGQLRWQDVDVDLLQVAQPKQALLQQQLLSLSTLQPAPVIQQLPYYYAEQRQGYWVVGWKFPKAWQFHWQALYAALTALPWLRLKAILNSDQGWLLCNAATGTWQPEAIHAQLDSRLELIFDHAFEAQALERAILASRCDALAATWPGNDEQQSDNTMDH